MMARLRPGAGIPKLTASGYSQEKPADEEFLQPLWGIPMDVEVFNVDET